MLDKIAAAATALVSSGTIASATQAPPLAVVPTVAVQPVAEGWAGARFGGLWTGSRGGELIDEKTVAANIALGNADFEIEGRGAGFLLSRSSSAAAMGSGHLYLRSAALAVGGFAGLEVVPGVSAGYGLAGLEAKAFDGPLVFLAQAAGELAVDQGSNSLWWVRAGLQAFGSDNLVFEGDLRYLTGGFTSWLVSGSAELRPAGYPWAWQATVNYETHAGADGSAATSVLAGLKIHLGNGTLYQAYTSGAVWNLLPLRY